MVTSLRVAERLPRASRRAALRAATRLAGTAAKAASAHTSADRRVVVVNFILLKELRQEYL
jgi:hypothetical protein